ncbi:MAG: hypothetical protein OEY28_12115, partial [Nitrospira sp.]|nr:hypothetical protein [Nitrospira sp.]
ENVADLDNAISMKAQGDLFTDLTTFAKQAQVDWHPGPHVIYIDSLEGESTDVRITVEYKAPLGAPLVYVGGTLWLPYEALAWHVGENLLRSGSSCEWSEDRTGLLVTAYPFEHIFVAALEFHLNP